MPGILVVINAEYIVGLCRAHGLVYLAGVERRHVGVRGGVHQILDDDRLHCQMAGFAAPAGRPDVAEIGDLDRALDVLGRAVGVPVLVIGRVAVVEDRVPRVEARGQQEPVIDADLAARSQRIEQGRIVGSGQRQRVALEFAGD